MMSDEVAAASGIDVTKTHVVKELKHDSPIISCRFDRSGRYVFFGAEDSKVWRWEWSGENKVALDHGAWVRGIATHPGGETVITAGFDGRLIWWPVVADQPEPIQVVQAHDGWARCAAVSPDGQFVASAGNDLRVKLWSAEGQLVQELSGHQSHVYNVAFHPDGKSLVSGDLKANLIHWEVPSGKQARQLKAESLCKYDETFKADIGGFRGLAFDSAGTKLAGCGITNVTNAFAGVGNPAVVVYDWESGEQAMQHESKGKLQGTAWGLALHPANLVIGGVGGNGGYLLFWKPDEKEEFHQLKVKDTVRDLDLHGDAAHVVTGHYDRHIRVFKLSNA